jgi:DNA-binding response OmpR family regulator
MADGKPKVLLVEDDPFMVTLLAEGLGRDGFEVVVSPTGEDAVSRFSEAKPDVLLIDILLPKKSGLEALGEIRLLPGGAGVPALIISNLEDANYVRDAEKLHAFAYLIKANMQISDIVAKVKEALGQAKR